MVRWTGYLRLEALVAVDALGEDLMAGVDDVEDGISVHLLTGRKNADLEEWSDSVEKLL